MTRRRRLTGALAAVVVAAVVTACSSIPDSGGVQSGDDVDYALELSDLNAVVEGPPTNATPEVVVSGFLAASASGGPSGSQARGFLTQTAAQTWVSGSAGVRIVADTIPSVVADGPRVTATFAQEAVIEADGRYSVLPEPQPLTTVFDLVDVGGGQWRINDLEPGLILRRGNVDDAYTPTSIYFLDPGRHVLVPDLRMVPRDDVQATTLTDRLLDGPSRWLKDGVTTAFPTGTTLTTPSVPVEDGIAQVDLSDAATVATTEQRQQLAAQLAWTLGQLDEVVGVRITVVGSEFTVGGGSAQVVSSDNWPAWNADVVAAGTADPVVVRDDVLGRLEGTTFTPVGGAAAPAYAALDQLTLSTDGGRVAGIRADGLLVSGPLVSDDPPAALGVGGLSSPSFDRNGALWALDAKNSLAVVFPAEGERVTIPLVGAETDTVTALRVSRDGTRVVAVVRRGAGQTVQVGVVARFAETAVPQQVISFTPVELEGEVVSVLDVAWADATTLAVLGAGPDGITPTVQLVTADGYESTRAAPLPGAVALTAAPGVPLVAATQDGTLYRWDPVQGSSWTAVGPGSDPAYPG